MIAYKSLHILITKLFLCMVLLAVLLLLGCNNILKDSKDQNYGNEFIPKGSENIPVISSTILGDLNEEQALVPKKDINLQSILTLLPSNFLLQGSAISSVSAGFQNEYVIAYATQEDLSLKLLIASYDIDTQRYQFVKQLNTQLHGAESVDITVQDITGDFTKEIIIIGKNEQKEAMIHIFYLEDAVANPYAYVNVFTRIATDIDILEKNKDRYKNEADVLFQIFFQIVVYQESNNGEIQREYFQWDDTSKSFILSSIDRFTSSDVSQEKLLKLHQAKDKDFQVFLKGGWERKRAKSNSYPIKIFFSNSPTQVSIFQEGKAHIYQWQSSFRRLANYGGIALQVNLKSLILPSIFNWILLEIIAEDEIYVYTSKDSTIDLQGEYSKVLSSVPDSTKHEVLNNPNSKTHTAIQALTGKFLDANSSATYVFSYPRLRIILDSADVHAYYSIFELNNLLVLEIGDMRRPANFYIIQQDEDEAIWRFTPILLYADSYYIKQNAASLVLSVVP